jgi:anti-anti-sigma factor
MNGFRATVTDRGDHVSLALAGDLDLSAHEALTAQIATLIGVGHALVVDCAQVTFMDSMGLNALVGGLRLAAAAGLAFELAALSDPVLRVMELSGTAELFTVRGLVPEESASES